MKREGRIIMYLIVGGLFPLASQLLNPELPLWEPLSFTALVVLLGGSYELYTVIKGKK